MVCSVSVRDRPDNNGLLIDVFERRYKKPSRGGSNFHTAWTVTARPEHVKRIQQERRKEAQYERLQWERREQVPSDTQLEETWFKATNASESRAQQIVQSQIDSDILSAVACSTVDHFNGSYTICCRRPMHVGLGISNITVLLQYSDYALYQSPWLDESLQRLIFQRSWDGSQDTTHRQMNEETSVHPSIG